MAPVCLHATTVLKSVRPGLGGENSPVYWGHISEGHRQGFPQEALKTMFWKESHLSIAKEVPLRAHSSAHSLFLTVWKSFNSLWKATL